MISLHAKNLESAHLTEPHVVVMFSCRTLTRSAMVSRRNLQIAEPKALNLKKDYLAEPWNAGSFRSCPLKAMEGAGAALQAMEMELCEDLRCTTLRLRWRWPS